ncbi:MAG: hypothetical protein P8X46_02895 [Nitrospirales bacterium]
MKLNVKAFALACAVLWGFGVFILTWWLIAFEGATEEPTWLGKVYWGYTVSPVGVRMGAGRCIDRWRNFRLAL